jgi:hypothetical protein
LGSGETLPDTKARRNPAIWERRPFTSEGKYLSLEIVMRVLLFDEMPDLDEPPVVRMWCDWCKRRTQYRYDQFGFRQCIDCNDDEDSENV